MTDIHPVHDALPGFLAQREFEQGDPGDEQPKTELVEECDPITGFHVVLPGNDRCQCGERGRMIAPQEDLPAPSNIVGCARCGGEHFVRFKPFRVPMQIGEATFTHWGLCPSTKEPILMRFVTVDGGDAAAAGPDLPAPLP